MFLFDMNHSISCLLNFYGFSPYSLFFLVFLVSMILILLRITISTNSIHFPEVFLSSTLSIWAYYLALTSLPNPSRNVRILVYLRLHQSANLAHCLWTALAHTWLIITSRCDGAILWVLKQPGLYVCNCKIVRRFVCVLLVDVNLINTNTTHSSKLGTSSENTIGVIK